MATSMAAVRLCSSLNLSHPKQKSSSSKPSNKPNTLCQLFFDRRSAMAIALSTTFMAGNRNTASAFEFTMTVPDQTIEEAEAVIRSHAQNLLQIKALVESESWRDAQFALRESSGYLKQDLYTIIQAKPASQRSPLRKLYSTLFNNVSKLDYAARSKDATTVKQCYDNIATTLGEILAKL